MIAINFYKTEINFHPNFNCQYCLKFYMNCFANFIYYYYLYILSKRHSGYPTWKSWMRQVKDHYQANKNLAYILIATSTGKKMKKLASCSWNVSLNYMYPRHTYVLTPLIGFFFKFLSRSEVADNLKILKEWKKLHGFWWVARFSFDSKSHLGPYSTNPFYLKIFLFRALRKNHLCSL